MKYIILIITALLSISNLQAHSPAYTEGEVLNVFAASGLKLRAEPHRSSPVLDIVQYGDQVKVLNTFEFAEDLQERIDWIDGHWILVEFGGQAGYLFDGYLSSMPLPASRDELVLDGYSFAYALGQYMEQHFEIDQLVDSTDSTLSYVLEDGTAVKQSVDINYWIVEINSPSYHLHELLNLMRAMIPDRKMRSAFERSLLFIENEEGSVSEIKLKLGDEAILRKTKTGKILVKASGYSGC
ncbi:MAG: SH3 domain-containing protein [Saprospiraceae bacterium]|nr:SH3 domain-containing protein [Saprospiraceae bacterium]